MQDRDAEVEGEIDEELETETWAGEDDHEVDALLDAFRDTTSRGGRSQAVDSKVTYLVDEEDWDDDDDEGWYEGEEEEPESNN